MSLKFILSTPGNNNNIPSYPIKCVLLHVPTIGVIFFKKIDQEKSSSFKFTKLKWGNCLQKYYQNNICSMFYPIYSIITEYSTLFTPMLMSHHRLLKSKYKHFFVALTPVSRML